MSSLASLHVALRSGPVAAAALRSTLGGISAPTLTRLMADAGDEVIRFGRARASAYALARTMPGVNRRYFPVVEIDASGLVSGMGRMVPVHDRGYLHLTGEADPDVAVRGCEGEFHEGLPWWMADMAPQGFLGRAFAQRHAAGADEFPPLPANPADWSDDLRLAVIGSARWTPPGNLIVGDHPHSEDFEVSDIARDFPDLARRAMAGDVPGSSAAGEQPKFCCRMPWGDGMRDVMVKFSWGETDASRVRRADLLVCEGVAAGVFDGEVRLEVVDGVTYLATPRWDRTPGGRRGVVSLGALDDAFVGSRRSWSHSAAQLAAGKIISRADAAEVRRLECFARMIGNNDRHSGNISFFRAGLAVTGLTPVYDMLPMRYAPAKDGACPLDAMTAGVMTEGSAAEDIIAMLPRAVLFWESVAAHGGVSVGFRETAAQNAATLAGLSQRRDASESTELPVVSEGPAG